MVLINAMFRSLPTYAMIFLLPKGCIKRMDYYILTFFSGNVMNINDNIVQLSGGLYVDPTTE
jgi:hypothetical protein